MALSKSEAVSLIPAALAAGPLSFSGLMAALGVGRAGAIGINHGLRALAAAGAVRYCRYLRMWTVHPTLVAIALTHRPVQEGTKKGGSCGQEKEDR